MQTKNPLWNPCSDRASEPWAWVEPWLCRKWEIFMISSLKFTNKCTIFLITIFSKKGDYTPPFSKNLFCPGVEIFFHQIKTSILQPSVSTFYFKRSQLQCIEFFNKFQILTFLCDISLKLMNLCVVRKVKKMLIGTNWISVSSIFYFAKKTISTSDIIKFNDF